MTIHILPKKETQEILDKLKKQFGIQQLNGKILRIGTERLFFYQGSLTNKEIKQLEQTVPVERVGVYFAKIQNDQVRLSIEGTHLLKDQITKNICSLNNEAVDIWMHGSELLLDDDLKKDREFNKEKNSMLNSKSLWAGGWGSQKLKKGFVIMKHDEDFLGTGKLSEEKITNFIPKSRRLKFKG